MADGTCDPASVITSSPLRAARPTRWSSRSASLPTPSLTAARPGRDAQPAHAWQDHVRRKLAVGLPPLRAAGTPEGGDAVMAGRGFKD